LRWLNPREKNPGKKNVIMKKLLAFTNSFTPIIKNSKKTTPLDFLLIRVLL